MPEAQQRKESLSVMLFKTDPHPFHPKGKIMVLFRGKVYDYDEFEENIDEIVGSVKK